MCSLEFRDWTDTVTVVLRGGSIRYGVEMTTFKNGSEAGVK